MTERQIYELLGFELLSALITAQNHFYHMCAKGPSHFRLDKSITTAWEEIDLFVDRLVVEAFDTEDAIRH